MSEKTTKKTELFDLYDIENLFNDFGFIWGNEWLDRYKPKSDSCDRKLSCMEIWRGALNNFNQGTDANFTYSDINKLLFQTYSWPHKPPSLYQFLQILKDQL